MKIHGPRPFNVAANIPIYCAIFHAHSGSLFVILKFYELINCNMFYLPEGSKCYHCEDLKTSENTSKIL